MSKLRSIAELRAFYGFLGKVSTHSTIFFRRVGEGGSGLDGPVFCVAPSGDDNVSARFSRIFIGTIKTVAYLS